MSTEHDMRLNSGDYLAVGLIIVFTLVVRYLFRHYITVDYVEWTGRWYGAVKEQGFAATGTAISNYTPPYMYALYFVSRLFPRLAPEMAIKLPAIACDFLCAWLTYCIVRLKYPLGRYPLYAFAAVLAAPTVICNSAVWGQADSIYTAPLLACIYCLMTRRATWAMLAFGVAVCIKLQAIFLAPALCVFWLRGAIRFWKFWLIPAVYVLAMVPAALAGRPVKELATIYLSQGDTYHSLTLKAPTLYAWLPDTLYGTLIIGGLFSAIVVACWYVWYALKHRLPTDPQTVLKLSLLSLIMMPFFLPMMHERYFYPADVLAIAYAFYVPRRYYVAICISFASFCAYTPFLFRDFVTPLKALSLIMAIALISTARSLHEGLRGQGRVPVITAQTFQ